MDICTGLIELSGWYLQAGSGFFFFTLVTGPRTCVSLKLTWWVLAGYFVYNWPQHTHMAMAGGR